VIEPTLTRIEGGLLQVPGLRGAACRTGVKPSGDADLALVVADRPMAAVGMFTTNAVAAPPVHVSREALRSQPAVRSIVINSGNANALTGAAGERDARRMVEAATRCCGGPALVLSTGVIGVPLPIDDVVAGIGEASRNLTRGADDAVARAIMTTDTAPKTHAVRLDGGGSFTVAGMAKGSGMIHPRMATMLAVIATDAPASADWLQACLQRAVDRSFHQISVDGDTSTNDAVLLLAREPVAGEGLTAPVSDALEAAITQVAQSLARQIIEDGEGASRVMDIRVSGAASEQDARRVASAIACSSLVKCALAGGDPNWGRILSAAGTSGVAVSPERLTLTLGGCAVFRHGSLLSVDASRLAQSFAAERVHVELDLGVGDGSGRMLTTDLTHRYVEINSEYTT
jgi:glutamate N-acetyltransferase/amino-acid N-acetyltransferase